MRKKAGTSRSASPIAPPAVSPAPDGIDAFFSWELEGGAGAGISLVDLEWSWNVTHEEHPAGDPARYGPFEQDPDHGTAVIGELGSLHNASGVAGICSEDVSVLPFGPHTAQTIEVAAATLARGDVLLLEIHLPGPRHDGRRRDDQDGYIPIGWWPTTSWPSQQRSVSGSW